MLYPSIILGAIAFIYLLIIASKRKNYTSAINQTATEQQAQPSTSILPGMTKDINSHNATIETTGGTVILNCKVNPETFIKDIMIDKNQILNVFQAPPGRTKLSLGNPEIDKKLLVYVVCGKENEVTSFFQNNPIILQKIVELYNLQFCIGANAWESNGVFAIRYKEQGLIKPEKVSEVSNKMIEIFSTLTQALPQL